MYPLPRVLFFCLTSLFQNNKGKRAATVCLPYSAVPNLNLTLPSYAKANALASGSGKRIRLTGTTGMLIHLDDFYFFVHDSGILFATWSPSC